MADELLFSLNDSHGIAPEMAISLAQKSGWEAMTLRTGFTAELAERQAAYDSWLDSYYINKTQEIEQLGIGQLPHTEWTQL